MSLPNCPTSLVSSWIFPGGEPAGEADRALLDAILLADLGKAKQALSEGADLGIDLVDAHTGTQVSLVFLATEAPQEFLHGLIDLYLQGGVLERKKRLRYFLRRSTWALSVQSLEWILHCHAELVAQFDKTEWWRMLSSSGHWSLLVRNQQALWVWENIHATPGAYAPSSIWVKALLSNDPDAKTVQHWMESILKRYARLGTEVYACLAEELDLRLSLESHPASKQCLIQALMPLFLNPGPPETLPEALCINAYINSVFHEALNAAKAYQCAKELDQLSEKVQEISSRGRL